MYVSTEIYEKIEKILNTSYDVYIPEEFKYVTYPGVRPNKYAVGNYGTIYNIEKDIIMAQSLNSNGYLGLTLSGYESGVYNRYYVHRLVAWEFVDGYDELSGKTIVNHKDSMKTHNYDYNLEWCTSSENSYHGFNNDITYSAKRSLTKREVKRICELFEEGKKVIEVFQIITGLNKKIDDEKTYKKIVRIHTRKYYNNVSKYYNW